MLVLIGPEWLDLADKQGRGVNFTAEAGGQNVGQGRGQLEGQFNGQFLGNANCDLQPARMFR